mgnify:CR=1 FL=1
MKDILNDNIEITEEMKIVANTNIVIDGQSKYFILQNFQNIDKLNELS